MSLLPARGPIPCAGLLIGTGRPPRRPRRTVPKRDSIKQVNRFRDSALERVFEGRPVPRLPAEIQCRARVRLQRVVAAAALSDVAAVLPPTASRRCAETGRGSTASGGAAQHPDQRPVTHLFPLDGPRRPRDRSYRLPL